MYLRDLAIKAINSNKYDPKTVGAAINSLIRYASYRNRYDWEGNPIPVEHKYETHDRFFHPKATVEWYLEEVYPTDPKHARREHPHLRNWGPVRKALVDQLILEFYSPRSRDFDNPYAEKYASRDTYGGEYDR